MGPVGGKSHFFGDHPKGLRNHSPYPSFIRNFGMIARDCQRLGLEVVNASPVSQLDCFPRVALREALKERANDVR